MIGVTPNGHDGFSLRQHRRDACATKIASIFRLLNLPLEE